ncbi:MAG: glycerol-3-phosphate dehydrogenase [Vicingaceae bacterium]|nr:MAG: glycerol-3-phosphate dehydrogenase [Vicingaceae bacterium]GIV42515.1 MAG: glycerol-3-phosphate dehydrogenase [Vicingaceae bacterium]
MNERVGVLGSGSWATALVKILSENEDTVNWWIRNYRTLDYIKQYGHNPNYLSSASLNVNKLNLYQDVEKFLEDTDIIVVAVPAAFLHQTLNPLPKKLWEGKKIVSAIKGMIPEFHSIPARYYHKQWGIPYEDIAMISGPCHAEEVAMEKLSYLTVASENTGYAEKVASKIRCRFVKSTVSDDLFGTELSAIMKNIYALCAGIYHGLGYGDNFQAVLISNSIQEIERFVDAVNPIHRDVKTSAYLGDLLVTAYSQFSRNRTFGSMIGKGYSVKTAQLELNMTAEGYYAVKSIIEINKKFNVDIPICMAVYRVLYEKISPWVEMQLLTQKLS